METNNIAFPSKATIFRYQKEMHIPIVNHYWSLKSAENLERVKTRGNLHLGGDGR